MATPITSLDSPNIVNSTTNTTINITGSKIDQADFTYLLAQRYTFTGSVINTNTVGFGYGLLPVPSGSFMTYSFSGQTTQADFVFDINGVTVPDYEILAFSQNGTNTQATLSLQLPYDLIPSDIISGKGRWNAQL